MIVKHFFMNYFFLNHSWTKDNIRSYLPVLRRPLKCDSLVQSSLFILKYKQELRGKEAGQLETWSMMEFSVWAVQGSYAIYNFQIMHGCLQAIFLLTRKALLTVSQPNSNYLFLVLLQFFPENFHKIHLWLFELYC